MEILACVPRGTVPFYFSLCFRFNLIKMKKHVLFGLSLLGAAGMLVAQESNDLNQLQQLDSVYIDSKTTLDRKNSGKTVVVISKDQIKANAGRSVAQILNELAGFEMNGSNSNNGQNLGYFVRGGRNRQVLVLMDGVPLNDASQISNDYDLRLLPLDQIERIEVMKGASSVLYGSGAATAVISITSTKSSKEPFQLNVSSVIGSDRSAEDRNYQVEALTNSLGVQGTLGKFFYQGTLNHRYSDGLSAIAAPDGSDPFMEDPFDAFQAKANFGVHLTKNITVSQFVSVDNMQNSFDDFSYQDANFKSTSKQWRTGGHFEWKYKNGVYIFNDNYSSIERVVSSSFPAKYDSNSYSFDNYLQHRLGTQLKAIVGLNGNFSKMNSYTIPYESNDFEQEVNDEQARFNYFDPYINFIYTSSYGLNLNAGVRMNIHSKYSNHFVYQINPSYYMEFGSYGIKILGSYSTAYITPSLYQIYDPIYGNENLIPEENTTTEVGIELTKGKTFRWSVLYFQRKEDQFIDFVVVDPDTFQYQYQNTDESFEASGLETELSLELYRNLQWNANYTYTKRDDRFALRIPEHKVNSSILYQPSAKTSMGVQFQFTSKRDDNFFNPDTFENEFVSLASYTLFGLHAQQQLTKNLKVLVALDNIFNEAYEELYRYQTKGRNFRLGVNLNI